MSLLRHRTSEAKTNLLRLSGSDTIQADFTAKSSPLHPVWNRMIGAGYARDLLLAIVQDSIRRSVKEIAFQGFLLHGIFQDEIGAFRAACLDVSAACTGFLAVYELGQLYIRSGKAKNVLLIGADALSRLVDWSDRGTCILFGDGAGAVVLTAEEQETKACEKIHSDGEKGVSLTCEKGTYLQMDGRAVFQFALSRVPEVIREVLAEADMAVEEIDAFILHQANSRIIDGVAKRLKAPKEKFPRNIEAYGNTCAASIPILLDEWNRSGRAQKGQRIVLSGFGAGLIWGAAYLEW